MSKKSHKNCIFLHSYINFPNNLILYLNKGLKTLFLFKEIILY